MAKHLVWDWNGTLLDDFHAVVDATNATFAAVGGPRVDAEVHRERFRRPIRDYYSEMLGRDVSEAEWASMDREFHRHYQAAVAECRLARDAVEAMREWAGTQSLLSMWFHRELTPLVTRHGLSRTFARVDGLRQEVGGHSKLPYLEAHLAALDMRPEETVLVGDTVDDAHAAQGVGAACVLYTGGFTAPSRLRTAGAPVVDSLREAVRLAASA